MGPAVQLVAATAGGGGAPWPPATWGGLGGFGVTGPAVGSGACVGDIAGAAGVAGAESPARAVAGSCVRGAQEVSRPPRSPQQSDPQASTVGVQAVCLQASARGCSPARRPTAPRLGDSPEAPVTPPKKQIGTASPSRGRATPQQGSPGRSGCMDTPSPQQQVEKTPSPQQQAGHYRHFAAAMTPAHAMGHAALTPAHGPAVTPVAASQLTMVHTTQVHIAWRGPVTPVARSPPFYAVTGAAAAVPGATGPGTCGGIQCYASGTPVLPFSASPGDFHMCRPATYIQTPAPAPPLPCGASASPPLHRQHGASHGLTPGPSRVSLCGEETAACLAEWRRSDG